MPASLRLAVNLLLATHYATLLTLILGGLGWAAAGLGWQTFPDMPAIWAAMSFAVAWQSLRLVAMAGRRSPAPDKEHRPARPVAR